VLETEHYWTAGAAVAVDHRVGKGALRAWAEGIAGASWYEQDDKTADGDDATFLAARWIAAYRIGGLREEAPYLEPFLALGVFEPDADVVDDIGWHESLGVNVGLWNRARVTLQGEIARTMRNFPRTYFAGQSPDGDWLHLQAGAVF
jgi:hypothetical protein